MLFRIWHLVGRNIVKVYAEYDPVASESVRSQYHQRQLQHLVIKSINLRTDNFIIYII